MEYAFHLHNQLATDGITMAADKLLRADYWKKQKKTIGAGTYRIPNEGTMYENNAYKNKTQENPLYEGTMYEDNPPPIIVCVGSDLAIGDCLGPITGSMLKYKTQGLKLFLYGTLASPVTAKEIPYMRTFLKETHKGSQIIAVDAAVGNEGDIGLMKISDTPLFPGAGAQKKLGALGDLSIMGIVAEKSIANYNLFNTTRLNLVYKMAEILSDSLSALLWERAGSNKPLSLSRKNTI